MQRPGFCSQAWSEQNPVLSLTSTGRRLCIAHWFQGWPYRWKSVPFCQMFGSWNGTDFERAIFKGLSSDWKYVMNVGKKDVQLYILKHPDLARSMVWKKTHYYSPLSENYGFMTVLQLAILDRGFWATRLLSGSWEWGILDSILLFPFIDTLMESETL